MRTLSILNFVLLVLLGYALYHFENRTLQLESTMAELQEYHEAIEVLQHGERFRIDTCSEPKHEPFGENPVRQQEDRTKVTKTVCISTKSGRRVVAQTQAEQIRDPNCQMCITCPGWRFGSVRNGRAFCDTCSHMSDMHPLAKKMFCVLDACTCEGWMRGAKDPSGFYICARCGHLEGCHNK